MHIKRAVRVAEKLKREIGRILIEELKDPISGKVTITDVKMTDDLRYARIYFTVIGDKSEREQVTARLDGATKFIKGKIAHLMDLRYVPEIRFYYDSGAEHAENIERLFQKIKEEEL